MLLHLSLLIRGRSASVKPAGNGYGVGSTFLRHDLVLWHNLAQIGT